MITIDELRDVMRTPWILKEFGTKEDGSPHCLSLLRWAYNKCGIHLPEDYIRFIESFKRIPDEKYIFMDIVCMSIRYPFMDHVGICLGDGHFIHVVPKKNIIVIHSINDPYWQKLIKGILRHKTRESWQFS